MVRNFTFAFALIFGWTAAVAQPAGNYQTLSQIDNPPYHLLEVKASTAYPAHRVYVVGFRLPKDAVFKIRPTSLTRQPESLLRSSFPPEGNEATLQRLAKISREASQFLRGLIDQPGLLEIVLLPEGLYVQIDKQVAGWGHNDPTKVDMDRSIRGRILAQFGSGSLQIFSHSVGSREMEDLIARAHA